VKSYFGENLSGKTLALWGLAFKPETDDIREAPALYMINALLELGAKIIAYDPEAMTNVKDIIGDQISYADSSYDALKDVDALLIATEWSAFRNPDFEKMEELTRFVFAKKRKMLRTIFKKEGGSSFLNSINVYPNIRPENLTLDEFCKLEFALRKH